MMLSTLTACGGEKQAEEPETEEPKADISALDDELQRAYHYGLLPDSWVQDINAQIKHNEYFDIISLMIERWDADKLEQWQKRIPAAAQSKEFMRREDGMLMLSYAYVFMGHGPEYPECRFDEHAHPELFYTDEMRDSQDSLSWNYPLYSDWEDEVYEVFKSNYMWGSVASFPMIASPISGKLMINWDENGSLNLQDAFSRDEAVRALLRMAEYLDIKLERIEYADDSVLAQVYAQADTRREAILNSPTEIVKSDTFVLGETYTGTAYYVSNSGDDSNSGINPESPFATIEPFYNITLQYGDAIFFERGSVWRGVELPWEIRRTEGLTISAYGDGAKPAFYGSEENGTGAEKWELYYSDDSGSKIWKFYRDMTEVSTIVIGGDTVVYRDVAYWDGEAYWQLDERHWDTTGESYELSAHLPDMWCIPLIEYPHKLVDDLGEAVYYSWDDEEEKVYHAGPLYFRCDAGNPGELYDDIEFIMPHGINDGMAKDQCYDNICAKYSSSTFTSGFDGVKEACSGVIQNCEIGWAGGSVFNFATGEEEGDTRITLNSGLIGRNSGVMGINGSDYTIRDNYIHDAFQEGIAMETFIGSGSMENNHVYGNLIERTTQAILICNWDMEVNPEHIHKNILVEDNLIIDSGIDNFFSTEYESDYCNAVVLQGGPCANENLVIRNNTIAVATGALIQIDQYSEEYSKVFEGNRYIQYADMGGDLANYGIAMNFNAYIPATNYTVSSFLGDDSAAVYTLR